MSPEEASVLAHPKGSSSSEVVTLTAVVIVDASERREEGSQHQPLLHIIGV